MMVVGLVGLLVGLTFPSLSSGIDALRIAGASDSIASFLNGALNRADRRQEVMEIEVSLSANTLRMRSARPGFEQTLEMPEGIEILGVLPPIPAPPETPRRFLVFPGGAAPRIGIEIENRRGDRRVVRVDPMTGVPQIEREGSGGGR